MGWPSCWHNSISPVNAGYKPTWWMQRMERTINFLLQRFQLRRKNTRYTIGTRETSGADWGSTKACYIQRTTGLYEFWIGNHNCTNTSIRGQDLLELGKTAGRKRWYTVISIEKVSDSAQVNLPLRVYPWVLRFVLGLTLGSQKQKTLWQFNKQL